MEITILVPNGNANLNSIAGPYEILNKANRYWKELGHKSVMEIKIAGFVPEVKLSTGLFSIHPVPVESIKKTDLIIIPAVAYTDELLKDNKELIDWVREQYKAGTELATICSGAFLLAATGLLEGKSCSTHWNLAANFRRLFPGVNLLLDQLITSEKGIYTNGGAFSFLNLMLFLVEKYFDRETAIYCSKVFQIDNTVFDTKKMKIVTFLKSDVLYNQYNFDPVVFAWNIDPLAHMYPSISPYAFCANSPIRIKDADGRVLVLTGDGADKAVTQMQTAVGDFFSVVRDKKTGIVSFIQNSSAAGKPTIQQQTAASIFTKIADPSGKTTSIEAVKRSSSVQVGSYDKGQVDMSDIAQFDKMKNKTGSPNVYSSTGKMLHEFEEQYQKQAVGASELDSHNSGIGVENSYNGSARSPSIMMNGQMVAPSVRMVYDGSTEYLIETVMASDGRMVEVNERFDATNLKELKAAGGGIIQENLNGVTQERPGTTQQKQQR